MNGLINQAIEQLVVSMKGEAGWRGVCAHARVPADGFASMQNYDDAITYRLVEAVSARLELPQEQVLEAFGEYWITYTAEEGYGTLMATGGSHLREFLTNLNDMHGRVELIFAQLRIPLFRIEDVSDFEYRLYYASERNGLAPMVLGLVKGLAKRFNQSIEIVQIHSKTDVNDEDVFSVRHLPN
jgi:hypothetical protein